MPFGKVAMFLDEVLRTAAKTHARTVRNYTQRVGQRLERHQDTLPTRFLARPPTKWWWGWTAALFGADSRVPNEPLKLSSAGC
jgi:hypothetical protein